MRIPLRRYWRLLASYLLPQWRRVALLGVLLLATIGMELANPLILRYFIDMALAGGATGTLVEAALLFIGVALLTQAASVAETYVAENVGWTATNLLRGDLALHCLKLDMAFHNARTPGELIERIDGDVTALANFFSRFVINVLGNALLLIGALALLFGVDWRVGLALTLFVALALAVMLRIRGIAQPSWIAVRQAEATFFGFLGEQLAGTEDIRSSGATAYVLRRMAEQMRGWLHITWKASLAGYSMWITSLFIFALGNAVAFALGASLYTAGAITLGTAYLIYQYTVLLERPTEQIRSQLQDLQQAGASIERIQELFAVQPAIRDGVGLPLPAGALSVEFDSAAFRYGAGDELALDDISFQVEPGRVLGVVGHTGSGKTTLTRLLLRLYDVSEGAVRLGGVDLRDLHLADLRERIGVVTQEVQLFHASVRDNLTFFDERIADDRIVRALREVGLGAWLAALPDGLDTQLTSGGTGLSAGEAQLLAFARVFLKEPSLVILDEASSRLDPATERSVQRATQALLRGRTAIIIAHRLATLHYADHILILDRGRIREQGERERLAGDPQSRFAELLHTGLEVAAV